MPKSFNADRIKNRLLVDAVVPKMLNKTLTIAEFLGTAIDRQVDQFFKELVGYMGTEADLASQLPGSDAPAWRALSEEYLRRKHSAVFWIYTMDSNATHAYTQALQRRGLKEKLIKTRITKLTTPADPLIQALRPLVGTEVFGGVEVKVKDQDQTTVYTSSTREVPTTVGGYARSSGKVRSYHRITTRTDRTNFSALRYTLTLRLWSKFSQTDFANIESRIGLSALNARKLIGKAAYQRPLIAPFLAYYSTVVIPDVIRATLEKKGFMFNGNSLKVTISTKGKFGGPL